MQQNDLNKKPNNLRRYRKLVFLIAVLCIPLAIMTGHWFIHYDIDSSKPFGYWEGIEDAKEELYEQYNMFFVVLFYGIFVGILLTIFQYQPGELNVLFMLLLGFLSLLVEHFLLVIFLWFPLLLSPIIFLVVLKRYIVRKQTQFLYLPIMGLVINGYFILLEIHYFQAWWSIFGD